MSFFSVIEDSSVLLYDKGSYKDAPLAQLEHGVLYAKVGSGYVRLIPNGDTSREKLSWRRIDPGAGSYRRVDNQLVWSPTTISMAAE